MNQTLNAIQETGRDKGANRSTDKLTPRSVPPLTPDERAVFAAFIRDKRIEARAAARSKEKIPTLMAILENRKAVEINGANVRLTRRYDYEYTQTIEDLEEALKMARARERKAGLAKADPKLGVAFEDIDAKTLRRGRPEAEI